MHLYLPNLQAIKSLPEISFWFIILSIGFFSFYFFYRSYQYLLRSRTLQDFPTAKIRSAAQGYTQLQGTQQNIQQVPIIAPLSQLPCTWYRYTIEYYSNNGWELIEHGESPQFFALNDGTGLCEIDPKGAQVETSRYDKWLGFSRHPNGKPSNILMKLLYSFGRFRYQEWRMQEGMPLLAMGNFRTYQENGKTIHVLYGDPKMTRMPFILTAIDRKKEMRNNQLAAFLWFLAYVAILVLIGTLAFNRYN